MKTIKTDDPLKPGVLKDFPVVNFDGTEFTVYDNEDVIMNNFANPEIRVKCTPVQVAVIDLAWGSLLEDNAKDDELAIKCLNIFKREWPERYVELNMDQFKVTVRKRILKFPIPMGVTKYKTKFI